MVSIKPGVSADLIFESDETKHQVPRMQTMIHSVAEKRISVTDDTRDYRYPLDNGCLSLSWKQRGDNLRYGFWARLKGSQGL